MAQDALREAQAAELVGLHVQLAGIVRPVLPPAQPGELRPVLKHRETGRLRLGRGPAEGAQFSERDALALESVRRSSVSRRVKRGW